MQLSGIKTESLNFTGSIDTIISSIEEFLKNIKNKNPGKTKYQLVHALVFAKDMSEKEVTSLNSKLGIAYRNNDFCVLGGDTSSGQELSIFISTIVF